LDQKKILSKLQSLTTAGRKAFAVLIDPDKVSDPQSLQKLLHMSLESKVDFFLVGGSLLTHDSFHQVIHWLKSNSQIPVIIFPGNNMQIDHRADGLLFLSLISGRNPELLIGQHVVAAPLLRKSNVEVIPTGYLLVESGSATSVSYMSQTMPIPYDKPSLAACTAMAGEMLGMKLIYMDAGSGASKPISQRMISTVRNSIDVPLIIGGGINSAEKAAWALEAGADVIVVGNGIEKDLNLLTEVSEKVHAFNLSFKRS
jgi:phosphoglycerol geranylgeranyltransferase